MQRMTLVVPGTTASGENNAENNNCYYFKCAAVYWKETKGISFPENGRMKLDNTHLSFSGIFGTKIDCNLKQIISVARAARMWGHGTRCISSSGAGGVF